MAGAATPGARLRSLLASPGCLVLPGAFNGLVARAVADEGFGAAYVSGGALSASRGVPDIGILHRPDFAAAISEVARHAPKLPVLADADTGFGDVPATVQAYVAAGAAGLHIEDQVFPKRCGHLDGKEVVPAEAFAEVVREAVAARDASDDPAFVICARTDVRSVHDAAADGHDDCTAVEAVAARLSLYKNAGADMVFPDGLHDRHEFEAVRHHLMRRLDPTGEPMPWLLANMTEFGKTEQLTRADFELLGYDAVLFPVSTLRAAMGAVQGLLQELRQQGEVSAGSRAAMMDRKELYRLLEYDQSVPPPGEAAA